MRDNHSPNGAPPTPPSGAMPAGRTFIVIAVCLLVWALLYAPELRRSAEARPVGTRRTVSMSLLAPLVWISDHVGLTSVTDAVSRAAGRGPERGRRRRDRRGPGCAWTSLPDAPASPKPTKPVKHDTRMREPTFDHQLRVAVVGDSLAAGIGYFAERVFKPFFVEVYKQGRISTGLARPDFFNWPAQMQQIVERADPDLVLVMLGENDNQGLLNWDGSLEQDIGTFDWAAHYEDRVERFAKTATAGGAHVVWIGLPNERDPGRWDFIQKQNAIYEAVADRLPNVAYFDTWDRVRGPRRRVQRLLPGGRSGDTGPRRRRRALQHRRVHAADAEGRRVRDRGVPARPEDLRELIRLTAS